MMDAASSFARRVRGLVAAATFVVLSFLAFRLLQLEESVRQLRAELMRLESSADTVEARSGETVLERLRHLEERADDLERDRLRLVRLPEIIMVRRWASRLDGQVSRDDRRLSWLERRVDSLELARATDESVNRVQESVEDDSEAGPAHRE